MKSRNVILTVLLLIGVLAFFFGRLRLEPRAREAFDRHPRHLYYTKHARCRMDCRHISEGEIGEIMDKGIINLSKSHQQDKPCPTIALQGTTSRGASLRVIFAQCSDETKVITCYNLNEEPECHCPGDERKTHGD